MVELSRGESRNEITHRKTFETYQKSLPGAPRPCDRTRWPSSSLSGWQSVCVSAAASGAGFVAVRFGRRAFRPSISEGADFCPGWRKVINQLSPENIYFHPPFSPFPGGEIPYKLDQNLRYRSEPGCDDGPPVLPGSQCLNDPEPWDRDLANLQPSLFDQYANNINEIGLDDGEGSPYLDIKTLTPKPILEEVPKFNLQDEIDRANRCRKAVVALLEPKTTDIYYSVLHCMKFWCFRCGGKGGFIHKRRKGYMYRKINRGHRPKDNDELLKVAAGWEARYFVFPVPEKDRDLFKSWDGLNCLLGVTRRVIRKYFPGSRVTAVPHLFGKKDWVKYHPHVNVTIWYRKDEHVTRKLSHQFLDAMKDSYARGLRCVGCSGVRGPGETIAGKRVVMHYGFKWKPEKVLHLIRYVTRPLGAEHLKAWQASENGQGMIDLCVEQLKGFQFIRHWDRWANCNYQDTEDAVHETASLIGSPVIFAGHVPIERIDELVASGQVKKVGDDLYRQPGRFSADYLPRGRIINLKEGVNHASGFDSS